MSKRLILSGGLTLDGRPDCVATPADVLVEGERIAAVGPGLAAANAEVLDASGLVVCPGFFDAHAHSDQHAFLDPSAQGRIYDGVTTEINGTCGLSYFPLSGRTGEERREQVFRKHGIEAAWTDAAGYFDALEKAGTAINRAFLVGQGALRAAVMGFERRPAAPDEVARMRMLLREALEQGAFGLSAGLCYPPGSFAGPEEILALCRTLAPTGRPYCTHMRSEGRQVLESADESIAWARESGAPLHISHVKVMGRPNWRKIDALEERLFRARAEGLDLTADRYPYLAAMTALYSRLPDRFLEGGTEAALARLRDPDERARLTDEMLRERGEMDWTAIRIGHAHGGAAVFHGMNLAEVAAQMGRPPIEAFFELLLMSRLNCSAIFFDMCEENLERILAWPFVYMGSDSAARALQGPTAEGKPHPRTFGTCARFLGVYVRERKRLSLSEAVARMTSLPARRFGLADRGALRPGAYADIVVFDPETIRDAATYDAPFQLSVGIRHVLVNGVPVLRDGVQTSARPGRVLRASGNRG